MATKEVCPLFGFLFGVMRYEFGAIEAIGVVTFVGMSVDYCLHLAHGSSTAKIAFPEILGCGAA